MRRAPTRSFRSFHARLARSSATCGNLPIAIFRARTRHFFLGLLLIGCRSAGVDLFRAFGPLPERSRGPAALPRNPAPRRAFEFRRPSDRSESDAQFGEQRRVPRQNSQVAVLAPALPRIPPVAASTCRSGVTTSSSIVSGSIVGLQARARITPPRSPPSSPLSPALLRFRPPCRTPARANRRAFLRRFP